MLVFDDIRAAIGARPTPVIFDKWDKFIYWPNNKVCQTSIARGALKHRAIVHKDNPKAWQAKFNSIDLNYFLSAFRFTVVRNPYDRAVSAYIYLHRLKGKAKAKERNFDVFCKRTLAGQGVAHDPHFNRQVDGMFFGGKMLVDFVGRYEHISTDWNYICSRIGHDGELPKNNTTYRHRDFSCYYSPQSRTIVRRIYSQDLWLLDYPADFQIVPSS